MDIITNSRFLVPVFSFTLGSVSAFFFRDELNMPTYLKIKMALVEHRLITRRPLSADLLALVDHKHGSDRMFN